MLLVVGRQDTGDLEAQIRGSRHAWDLRIISVSALLRLMSIMEDMEDPVIVQRIHSILIPREFTRLDDIADILFSAAEEIKQEVVPVEDEEEDQGGNNQTKEKKFIPVAFHEACISRIQVSLKEKLVKRSRAQYSTPDKTIIVNCAISKEHHPDTKPGYWFAFHPHQREALKQAEKAFVAFGCGTSKRVILMPFTEFDLLLDGMNVTQKDDRMYWHISIERKEERYFLHRRRGHKIIELTPFVLPNPA
jgi:hypothetical protein